MTDQKPNCGNCPSKQIHHNSGMGTDRPRCEITKWFLDTSVFRELEKDYFSKSCCPLHPGARSWLMRDVIEELEQQIIAAKKEHNHERIAGYAKAITFTQDGVEK